MLPYWVWKWCLYIQQFDSLIGRYDLKLFPQELTDHDDVYNLRVCNKHYASLIGIQRAQARKK